MTRHQNPHTTRSSNRSARSSDTNADLAYYINRDGVDAHRQELARLGHRALDVGVRPGAASVLIDDSSPDVARERAFAIVARGLDHHAVSSPTFVVVA